MTRVRRLAARAQVLLLLTGMCCGDPLSPLASVRAGDSRVELIDEAPMNCDPDTTCPTDSSCVHARCLACEERPQCGGDLSLLRCAEAGFEVIQTCDAICAEGRCQTPNSCNVIALCAGETSCCKADVVPGGELELKYGVTTTDGRTQNARTVLRSVRSFALDRFEVSTKRFLNFLFEYGPELRPRQGAGQVADIVGSGWDATWNDDYTLVPYSMAGLGQMLRVGNPKFFDSESEALPARGVNWYMALAFCIWDGGRLPTEAEWVQAATGGEDRPYPWSFDPPSPERATYTSAQMLQEPNPVGSRPEGRGRFGHEDLAGNVAEWLLDTYEDRIESVSCARDRPNECVSLGSSALRVVRGGSFSDGVDNIKTDRRSKHPPMIGALNIGFRCARALD